jgi:hypothetical protein
MNELEQATTDELIAELHRRYPACLFAGERPAPEGDDDTDCMIEYHGGITTAIGLAHRAAAQLTADANSEMGKTNDEDE